MAISRAHFLMLSQPVTPSLTRIVGFVVTPRMTWNHIDLDGELRARLLMRKSGFFVGSSPECEPAMGAVAFHESIVGRLSGDKHRGRIGDAG